MSSHAPASQRPEILISSDEKLGTPRLSPRASLLFLITASALGYALAYGAGSAMWHVFLGG